MKIAVIGTGIISQSHLSAISHYKNFTLCAVCDINEDAAKAYGEKYDVPYFTDYREIPVKTDAEAVILNLPHWLHCQVTEFFLHQGLHVLVEKPMANTAEECSRMLEAAKCCGKKLAVGHVQRFLQANRKVKEYCQSGELGKLCMITEYRTIDYFKPQRPKWFLDKKLAGGGIVMNYGAHALDKMYYVMDSRPAVIQASVGNMKNDCTIEGHAQIHIQFQNSVSANITFSGYNNAGYETVYYFTDGALKVVDGSILYVRTDKTWDPVALEERESFLLQLDAFYNLVNDLPSESPTGEYGKDVITAIEQIYGKG